MAAIVVRERERKSMISDGGSSQEKGCQNDLSADGDYDYKRESFIYAAWECFFMCCRQVNADLFIHDMCVMCV